MGKKKKHNNISENSENYSGSANKNLTNRVNNPPNMAKHSSRTTSPQVTASPQSSGNSQHFTRHDSRENGNATSPYQSIKNKGTSTPYEIYSRSAKQNSADIQYSRNTSPRKSENENNLSRNSDFTLSSANFAQFTAANPQSGRSSQQFTQHNSRENFNATSPYQSIKNKGTSTPYEIYSRSAKQNSADIQYSRNTSPRKSENTNNLSRNSDFTPSSANFAQFTAASPQSSRNSQQFTQHDSRENSNTTPPHQAIKNQGASTPYENYSRSAKQSSVDRVQHFHDVSSRNFANTNNQSINTEITRSTRYSTEVSANSAASQFTTNIQTKKFRSIHSAAHGAAFAVGVVSPFKQTQLHFNRTQAEDGKFKTKVSVVNSSNFRISSSGEFKGILHAVNSLAKTKIQGDVPSVTKTLNSIQPTTVKGKAVLTSAKESWKFVKFSGKATIGVALGAETATMVVSKNVIGAYTRTVREELSKQDTGKVVLAAASAGKFLINHVQKRRLYLSEKSKFKQKKQNFKYQKKSINPKRKREKVWLKKEKTIFLEKKEALSKSKLPIKKQMIMRNKEKYKATEKKIKNYRKTAKKLKNDYKKQMKSQKKVKKLNRQFNLPTEIALAGVKAPLKSVKDKILTADTENDMLTAVNKGVQVTAKAKRAVKYLKSQVARHSSDNFKKISKRQESLNNQSKRLKEKTKPKKKKKKYRKRKNQSVKDYVKQYINHILATVKTAFRGVFKQVVMIFLPIVILAVLIVGAVVFLQSFLPSTGFVLGTYTADDEQLSDAVNSYTLIARNFNKAISEIDDDDDSVLKNWKTSLKTLGVNTDDYKTKPASFVYGRSSQFNYEPADFDFDPYILWSFLSAYNYDFDKSAECRTNGTSYSPEYWEVNSATEDLLEELFYMEYSFEHYYTDSSHWEELSNYKIQPNNEGGREGTYNTIFYDFSHSAFRYRKVPNEIKNFAKDGWVHYDENSLEILNAKDNDKRTGWFLQDQRVTIENRTSFYCTNEYGQYYCYGTDRERTPCSWADGSEIWFCVSPWDTYDFNSSIFPNPDQVSESEAVCLVSFYQKNKWVNSAQLFYNVKKNCTFKEAVESILNSMSYPSERLQYFYLLVGDDETNYRGNHQCMKSPVNATMQELINTGRIYNSFGYDISEWNTNHCNLNFDKHNGLDIICAVGENVYSMIGGKVTKVSDNSVTVSAKDFELVYSNDQNEKSRKYDIAVTIYNVVPTVSAGDTIEVGKIIGTATDSKQCSNTDNSKYSTTYIHVLTKIEKSLLNQFAVAPELLIY